MNWYVVNFEINKEKRKRAVSGAIMGQQDK